MKLLIMSISAIFCLFLVAVSVKGEYDGQWTDAGGSSAHTGFKSETLGAPVQNGIGKVWEKFITPFDGFQFVMQPLVFNGLILLLSNKGTYYIVEEATGNVKTSFKLPNLQDGDKVFSQPLIASAKSGTAYLVSRCDAKVTPFKSTVYVHDATTFTLVKEWSTTMDEKTAKSQTGDFLISSSDVSGMIYLSSSSQSNVILGLELPDLTESFSKTLAVSSSKIYSSAVYRNSRLFVSQQGLLTEIDVLTGDIVSNITFQEVSEQASSRWWSPLVANEIAVVVSFTSTSPTTADTNLHGIGIDVGTASIRWNTMSVTSTYSDARMMATDGETTFIIREQDKSSIVAVRNRDGSTLSTTKCDSPYDPSPSRLIVTNDYVFSKACTYLSTYNKATQKLTLGNYFADEMTYHNKTLYVVHTVVPPLIGAYRMDAVYSSASTFSANLLLFMGASVFIFKASSQ